MMIGILIFSDPAHEMASGSVRLVEAIETLGHTSIKLYESLFTIESDQGKLILHYDGKMFVAPEVIIARPNFVQEPSQHAILLDALNAIGVPVLNGDATGLVISKNKLTQRLLFSKNNLAMPAWAISRAPDEALAAAKRIGFPVMIKIPFGTHGTGVFYADQPETFSPIADYLAVRDGNPAIVEKFVSAANRCDLRVFVLQGKVIAAMERHARAGDVRANASIGGTGTPVILSKDEEALAIRAAEICHLAIAGVDILRGTNGPLLIEINANPGFSELEKATRIDIAHAIVSAAVSLAKG